MNALKITQTSDSNKLTIEIPNSFISKKLEIIIFPFDDNDDLWNDRNLESLNKAYSTEEPEYDNSMLKEPNSEYGKR